MKLLLLVMALAGALVADSIGGKVTDAQGAVIVGAKVRLYASGSTQAKQAATDSAGAYRFEGITSGSYIVQVDGDGFRQFTRNVTLSGSATEDIQLEVGGVANSVLVTAEGSALTLDQTAKAISLVDVTEIKDRNEYSLSEILRNTPGVQIRNQGGPGQFTQIRIRGLRPDAAQVLIDGMRFRDASTTQGDATSFASTLNFVNLSRVEVMRGSGSSLYGTGAVGGSINMVTDQGGAPTHGDVQIEGGGLGFLRGRAGLGGAFLNNRLLYSGGFTHINVTKGIDGDDRNRSTGGQGFVRYDLTPRLHLSNRFFGSDDFVQLNTGAATTGIPAANFPNNTIIPVTMLPFSQVLVLNAGGRPDYGSATLVPSRNDPDNHRYSTFYSNMVMLRGEVSAAASWQASWQRLSTERKFASGPAGFGFQPVGFASVTAPLGNIDTVDARFNTGVRVYRLTVGYEFEREQFRDRQDNNQPGNARLIVNSRIRQNSNAVYLQNQFSLLGDRLQISASGRAQVFDLKTPEIDVRGVTNVYANVPVTSSPRALTGDFSIAYFVQKSGTKFRAHVGNSYRAPALYERYGAGFSANQVTGLANFTPYGDPRLSPDRYNSFDWGIDQYLFRERVRVSATHYYVRTVQAILFNSTINRATDLFGRTSGYLQGAGAINRGVELSVEARPTRSTVLNGSYAYVNAENERDLVIAGFYRTLNVPAHTTTFMATQRIGKRVDVTFDIFRGSRYYINYFAVNRNRAFEFPGFTKADLVGNYKLWVKDTQTLRFYAKIDNVFNQEYFENGQRNPKAWAIFGMAYSF
jgi:vitamin B12 transporter